MEFDMNRQIWFILRVALGVAVGLGIAAAATAHPAARIAIVVVSTIIVGLLAHGLARLFGWEVER
jgi:hypothetical protein